MTLSALVQRFGCAALCLTLALAPLRAQEAQSPASTQGQPAAQRRPADQRPPGEGLPRLPPDATTRHKLDLPGRSLDFSSTAGTIRLFDAASGAPLGASRHRRQAAIRASSASRSGVEASCMGFA